MHMHISCIMRISWTCTYFGHAQCILSPPSCWSHIITLHVMCMFDKNTSTPNNQHARCSASQICSGKNCTYVALAWDSLYQKLNISFLWTYRTDSSYPKPPFFVVENPWNFSSVKWIQCCRVRFPAWLHLLVIRFQNLTFSCPATRKVLVAEMFNKVCGKNWKLIFGLRQFSAQIDPRRCTWNWLKVTQTPETFGCENTLNGWSSGHCP